MEKMRIAGEGFKLKSTYAYDALLAAILRGDFAPGEKLSETMLAKALGVSRTPLREALRALNAEGFIQLNPNSKFVISSFSNQDAIEILQIRRLLEGEASKLAARKDDPVGQERLRRVCEDAAKIRECGEEERGWVFMENDIAFHKAVFEMAGNRRMLRMSASLSDRQARLYISRNTVDKMYNICLCQHVNILNAILEHDDLRAEAYAQEHIDFIIEQVKEM